MAVYPWQFIPHPWEHWGMLHMTLSQSERLFSLTSASVPSGLTETEAQCHWQWGSDHITGKREPSPGEGELSAFLVAEVLLAEASYQQVGNSDHVFRPVGPWHYFWMLNGKGKRWWLQCKMHCFPTRLNPGMIDLLKVCVLSFRKACGSTMIRPTSNY